MNKNISVNVVMRYISFVLMCILGMFSPNLASAEQDSLIVLTSADNPPYEFVKHGGIVGFDIDLIKRVADKIGVSVSIKDVPFNSIVPSIISGRCDMAIAALTPTEDRCENVDFSIPYQENVSAIVLVNDGEFSNMRGSNVVFPVDILEGKTVGVQLGTHHEADIRDANIRDIKIKRYDNIGPMVFEMLKSASGKGDMYAFIIGISEAKEIVKKHKELCQFPLKFSDFFAIALPKNSPYREKINQALRELEKDGELEALEAKWNINR